MRNKIKNALSYLCVILGSAHLGHLTTGAYTDGVGVSIVLMSIFLIVAGVLIGADSES